MFWQKKSKNIAAIHQKIDRIDTEDYLDQNYSCKEITEMMFPEVTDQNQKEILIKKINNFKLGKQRREARLGIKPEDSEEGSTLTEAKEGLAAAKIQLQIDQLTLKTDKLAAEREDFFGAEDIAAEYSDDPMMAMLMAFLNKSNQNNTQQPGEAQTQLGMSSPLNTNAVPGLNGQLPTQNVIGTIDLSDEEISDVMGQYGEQIAAYQKLPDSVIIKFLKANYPQFSEDSYQKILGHIKKKEINV